MLVRPCTPRDMRSIGGSVERPQYSGRPTMSNPSALSQHPKRVLVKWKNDVLPVISLDMRDDGDLERDRAVRFPYSRLDAPEDGNTESLLHSLKSDMRALKALLKSYLACYDINKYTLFILQVSNMPSQTTWPFLWVKARPIRMIPIITTSGTCMLSPHNQRGKYLKDPKKSDFA